MKLRRIKHLNLLRAHVRWRYRAYTVYTHKVIGEKFADDLYNQTNRVGFMRRFLSPTPIKPVVKPVPPRPPIPKPFTLSVIPVKTMLTRPCKPSKTTCLIIR